MLARLLVAAVAPLNSATGFQDAPVAVIRLLVSR